VDGFAKDFDLTIKTKIIEWCYLVVTSKLMTITTLERPVKTGTVSIKLNSAYRDRLKTLAVSQKRTPHYLMKEAIQGYIEQAEIHQNFIRAGEESLRHYEATGLHNTFEELNSWLSTWGTPNSPDMPPCHT
jgi:predicted transcriptional regulator